VEIDTTLGAWSATAIMPMGTFHGQGKAGITRPAHSSLNRFHIWLWQLLIDSLFICLFAAVVG
jgi:hypothetical protein